MNNRRYPASLFIMGFIMNIIFHFFWLFVPAILLLIVGIFIKPCAHLGILILSLDIIVSFIEQWQIRNAFLSDSDNPDFTAFQDALSKDGNWIDNVKNFVEDSIDDDQ